jgi:ornithine cyclodeaminase/alanine dehydrogenase-like protein (mu-crystallin family)
MLPAARLRPMTVLGQPPLRYLDGTDVVTAMPPLEERLRLAERTMIGLVTGGELPPKIGVHPRPDGSFAHAMPASLRGGDATGAEDLLGIKWIAGFPGNRSRDLPAIHGLVILTDPMTGVPRAILDAGPITAERTAAISGVAIRVFLGGRSARRVALLGAGVQARSHLPVLGHVLPGLDLVVFDRHPDRADAVAYEAGSTPGVASAGTALTARDAVDGADVVVTVASFAPAAERQTLTTEWLGGETLVVAVDYATYVAGSVARDAAVFAVDHREQFLANRDAGNFDGYPDPAATIGEALLGGDPLPTGRILVSHLGVGLADLVFGDAILRRAEADDLGVVLDRGSSTPR